MKSDEKELVGRIRNVQNGVMERIVPEEETYKAYQEHIHRYVFASDFCKDKIVLDVACGVGYGSYYLTKNGAKRVIGVDISKDAITYAKAHYTDSKIKFIARDVTNLPFSDNFFDVIVSFETIEHVREYEKYLSECKRILKKGGIFICSSPNKRISSPRGTSSNPYHVQEFYLEEFYEMMNENFRDVKLYAQEYTSIIIRMGGKLLSLFPKERKLKDLIKRAIWRKGYTTVSECDITPSNSRKYQVFPFKKVLFMRPEIIISMAKK
jgi:ubiquinone/menaquinone biosynthesis C-methylase UbiE